MSTKKENLVKESVSPAQEAVGTTEGLSVTSAGDQAPYLPLTKAELRGIIREIQNAKATLNRIENIIDSSLYGWAP